MSFFKWIAKLARISNDNVKELNDAIEQREDAIAERSREFDSVRKERKCCANCANYKYGIITENKPHFNQYHSYYCSATNELFSEYFSSDYSSHSNGKYGHYCNEFVDRDPQYRLPWDPEPK